VRGKQLFQRVESVKALDMDPILRVAVGHPPFYRLDSSLSFQEEPWWTDAGGELYNQKDLERARRLLKEAGYQGEPVRYMAIQDSDHHRLALATKQQLEGVGFTVEVQPMEWSILWRRRTNPDLWDAHTIYWWPGEDPTLQWAFRCDEPGWNCDPDFAKLLQAIETELQFERRYRLWQDIYWLFWDRVPFIQHGDMFWLTVMRKHVQGPFDMRQWYFWNVWLDK